MRATVWTTVLTLVLVLALALAAGADAGDDAATEPIHLTLVAINDFHGALDGEPSPAGPEAGRWGSAAVLSAYVAAIRADNPDSTVLLDAGDMLQGPLLCNYFEGAPVADVYRHLGVAAAALGNHEFDYGPVGPDSVPVGDEDPRGALAAYAERVGIPILAANVHREGEGHALPAAIVPRHLLEVGGVKVGLIGISTLKTPTQTVGPNVVGLVFEDPAPAVAREVAALREDGAEVIVVLGHLSQGCRGTGGWPPPERCVPHGELAAILEGGGGEVDAVLAGHEHTFYANTPDGVAITESGSGGRSLARVELYVDPVTRRVIRDRTVVATPISVCEKAPAEGRGCFDKHAKGPWNPATYGGVTIVPDAQAEALIAPYREQIDAMCSETLATAAVAIARSRGDESAAGNLVADAMRQHLGADVAVVNGGSLRADLAPGPVTYCDVYSVFPFDTHITEVLMTGDELRELMRIGTSGAHSVLQVSGLRVVIDPQQEGGVDRDGDGEIALWERDRLAALTLDNGKAPKPKKTYRVLIPAFVYHRPDDMQNLFSQIPADRVTHHSDLIRDAMVGLLRDREQPLGEDGGWPLPQEGDLRIRLHEGD